MNTDRAPGAAACISPACTGAGLGDLPAPTNIHEPRCRCMFRRRVELDIRWRWCLAPGGAPAPSEGGARRFFSSATRRRSLTNLIPRAARHWRCSKPLGRRSRAIRKTPRVGPRDSRVDSAPRSLLSRLAISRRGHLIAQPEPRLHIDRQYGVANFFRG